MKPTKMPSNLANLTKRRHVRCRKFLKLQRLGRLLKGGSLRSPPIAKSISAESSLRQRPTPSQSPQVGEAARIFTAIASARRAAAGGRLVEAKKFIASAVAAAAGMRKVLAEEARPISDNLQSASAAAARVELGASKAADALKVQFFLDAAYHRFFYANNLLGAAASSVVPPPHQYFANGGGAAEFAEGLTYTEIRRTFFKRVGMEEGIGSEAARMFLGVGSESPDNPLLAILQSRWHESAIRLVGSGIVPSSPDKCTPAPAQIPGESLTMRGRDPVCGQLVREWRDSVRIWACHIYAYAVPNEEAVAVLKAHAPLVEIGAGTGYWASILRGRGAEICAYDVNPPPVKSAAPGREHTNEYHGKCHAWTSVVQGGPEAVSRHGKGVSLFLCYPPPDSAMALRALRAFQGQVLCHVGEWRGDTGTRAFHAELASTFELEQQVPLPNWGDSSAELTVWRRRGSMANHDGARCSPLECWGCGKQGDAKLQRCRLSYEAVFCSKRCAIQGAARHRACLAMRMALLTPGGAEQPPLPFGDPRYFKCAAG